MAFLTDDDYKDQIKDAILSTILDGSATNRTRAERKAQEQITAALNVRFDAAAVFAATGDARNDMIIMIMVDLTVYHLHSRISPGQVPQVRAERYQDALDWLKSVAGGKLEPSLPKPSGADEGIKYDVQYGGRAARDPYY